MKHLERTKYKQQKSYKASKISHKFLPSNLYSFIFLSVKWYSFVCLFVFSSLFLFFFLKNLFTIKL